MNCSLTPIVLHVTMGKYIWFVLIIHAKVRIKISHTIKYVIMYQNVHFRIFFHELWEHIWVKY